MEREVLVTGGNSGIGFEASRALARAGWRVLIASRNRAVSAEAVRRIEAEVGANRAWELGLDLGSLANVRAFSKELEARQVSLRALVLNAGVQSGGALRRSAEGHELTFAVNHLGHFLLTHLLLARLYANAPARIVVVSSGVHDPRLHSGMPKPTTHDPDELAATGGEPADAFKGRLAYVHSKLANLWFVYELARRLEASLEPAQEKASRSETTGLSGGAGVAGAVGDRRVTVNGYDPGLVPGSGLARDYPAPLRWVWNRFLPGVARAVSPLVPTVNPAPKAGAALARLVLDPALEGVSGKYFPSHTRWREAPSSEASYDRGAAQRLWQRSAELCGVAPEDSPLLGGASL